MCPVFNVSSKGSEAKKKHVESPHNENAVNVYDNDHDYNHFYIYLFLSVASFTLRHFALLISLVYYRNNSVKC